MERRERGGAGKGTSLHPARECLNSSWAPLPQIKTLVPSSDTKALMASVSGPGAPTGHAAHRDANLGSEDSSDLAAVSRASPVCAVEPCSAGAPGVSEKQAAWLRAWVSSSLSPADSSSEDSLLSRQSGTDGNWIYVTSDQPREGENYTTVNVRLCVNRQPSRSNSRRVLTLPCP